MLQTPLWVLNPNCLGVSFGEKGRAKNAKTEQMDGRKLVGKNEVLKTALNVENNFRRTLLLVLNIVISVWAWI